MGRKEGWSASNTPEPVWQKPAETIEEQLERKLAEIHKLTKEINEAEENIKRLVVDDLAKDALQVTLNSKRGLLEIRIDEYLKLKQKIHT